MRDRTPPPRLLLALLALTGLAACSSTAPDQRQANHEIEDMIRRGEYELAVNRARELQQKRPDDPVAEVLVRKAIAGGHLGLGRAASFDDRDEEALAHFEQALELLPDSQTVQAWIAKTHQKLAEHWLHLALELHAESDLEGAIAAYEAALAQVPGYPSAVRGLGEATLVLNHRNGLGEDYYGDGVRAMSDYWLYLARWNFTATHKYLPENGRAVRRRSEAEVMISDQRLAVAQSLEEEKLFAAAYNEYGWSLALNPDNEEAGEGRERVEPEAEAARLLDEAEMMIVRRRFDDAVALIAQAEPLTERQLEDIASMRERIVEARLDAMYEVALNIERDYQYPEAIAAYGRLLEATDFFKDALARKQTLEDYVRDAADYYARYEEEGDPEMRLQYLRAIRGFWPEYRDVADRIAELEAAQAARGDDAPPEEPRGDEEPADEPGS